MTSNHENVLLEKLKETEDAYEVTLISRELRSLNREPDCKKRGMSYGVVAAVSITAAVITNVIMRLLA